MDKAGDVRKNELEQREVNTHETTQSSSSSFLGLSKHSSTKIADTRSSSTVERSGVLDQLGATLGTNAVAISQQAAGSTRVLQSQTSSVEYTTQSSSNLLFNKLETSIKETVGQNVVSEQKTAKYTPSAHVQAAGMSAANDFATNLLTSDHIKMKDIAKHAAQAAGQSIATQVVTENIQKAIPTNAVGNAVIGSVVNAAFDLQHGKASVAAQHALENLASQALNAVADTSIPLTFGSSHTMANKALFGKGEYQSDVKRNNLDASFYGMKGGIHFEESRTTYTKRDGTVMHRKEAGLGAHGTALNTGVSLGLHNVYEKAETRTYRENGEIIDRDFEASRQGQFVGRVTFGDKEQLLRGPAFNSKETTTLTKRREDGEAYSERDGLPYKYLRNEAAAAGIADSNGVIVPSSTTGRPDVSGPASEAVAAARATVNVGHHQIAAGIGGSLKNGVSEKVYSKVEQTTKEKQGFGIISTTNGKQKMDIVTRVEKAFTSSESVVGDEFRTTFKGDVAEIQRTDLREETVSKRKFGVFKSHKTRTYQPGEKVLNLQEVDHLHLETSVASKADGSAFYESKTSSTSESTGEITQRTEKGMTRIDSSETQKRSQSKSLKSTMVGEYEEQRTSERDYESSGAAGKLQTVHERKIQTEAGTFEDLMSVKTTQSNRLVNAATYKPGENRLTQTKQLTSTYTQTTEKNQDQTKFHTDSLGTKTIEGVTGEVNVDVFAKQTDDMVYENHVSGDKGHSWSKASLGAFQVKEVKNADNGAQTFGTLAVTEKTTTENIAMGSASYVTETGTVATGTEPKNELASFQAGEKDLELAVKVKGSVVDTTWSVAKDGEYFSQTTLTRSDGAEITEVVNQVTDRRQQWEEKTQDDSLKQTNSAERYESGTQVAAYVGAEAVQMDIGFTGVDLSYTTVTKQEFKSFVDKRDILSGERADATLGDKSRIAEELYLTQVTTDKRSCGLFVTKVTKTVETTKVTPPTTSDTTTSDTLPPQGADEQPNTSTTKTTSAMTQFSQGSSRAIAATGGCMVNLAVKKFVHGKDLDAYDAQNASMSIADSFVCGTLTEVAGAVSKTSGGKAVAGVALVAGAISAGCSYAKKRNLQKQAQSGSAEEKKDESSTPDAEEENKTKKSATLEKVATVGGIVSDALPTVVQVGMSATKYASKASGVCTAVAVGLEAAKSATHYALSTKNADGTAKVDGLKLSEDVTVALTGAAVSIGTASVATAALPATLTALATTSLLASAATIILPATAAAIMASLTALVIGKAFGWARQRKKRKQMQAELARLCAEVGLSPNCTDSELRQQLKAMWLLHHPDKGGDKDTFVRENKKFEQISALRKELGLSTNSDFVKLFLGLVMYAYSNVTGAIASIFDNAIVDEQGQPVREQRPHNDHNAGIKSYERLEMLIDALEAEKKE